jgi:hypothetical protein
MPGTVPVGHAGGAASHATGSQQRPGTLPSAMQNANGRAQSLPVGHAEIVWSAVHALLFEHAHESAFQQSTLGSGYMSTGKQPMKSVRQLPPIAQRASLTTRHPAFAAH